MNKRKICAFALALMSSSGLVHAANGTMGMGKLLFFEAGLAYSHVYYKSSITVAESNTAATPGGFSINPSRVYPNNFWGGYLGLSLYVSDWLFNTRYNAFNSKSKSSVDTDITFSPVNLTFTLDRVWGCINDWSYGFGAGVVVDNINKGEANIIVADDNPVSETVHSTRIDPLIEGFVMYRLNDSVGVKLNVAYQIPVHDQAGRGALGVNLGLNYALPI